MKTQAFAPLADLRPYLIRAGMTARAVTGRRMTLAVIDIVPHGRAEEHHHENEQLGVVIRGRLRMRVGSQAEELGPGDTYAIPGDVPHEAQAGAEGATVLDVFAPVRADWEELPRAKPSAPDWPR